MIKAKVLIVDDNKEILVALKLLLSEEFSKIHTERNPSLIPGILSREKPDVIILDMNFRAGINTGNEGIFWLREILKTDPDAAVIMITAYGEIDLAVEAMKEGALDFIQKPWDDRKLLTTAVNAWKIRTSRKEIQSLKAQKSQILGLENPEYTLVTGDSPLMASLLRTIDKIAPTDAGVLILGENGTGKELIARRIHNLSERKNDAFVRVDLGALAPTLFESELFGYRKGAFTGADKDYAGRFEIASGGTLFLDEISNISPELQSKLLTAIQSGEVTPLGSTEPIPVDVRLISATNVSLENLIREKKFREDLLYRINTIRLDLPPLRERPGEIPALLEHFLKICAKKYNKPILKTSKEVIPYLTGYSWPGNIRELRHSIEKAVILNESGKLTREDFFFERPSAPGAAGGSLNLEENEKELIRKALRASKGNISKAAEDLGISRKTLYNKLDRYEIEPL